MKIYIKIENPDDSVTLDILLKGLKKLRQQIYSNSTLDFVVEIKGIFEI